MERSDLQAERVVASPVSRSEEYQKPEILTFTAEELIGKTTMCVYPSQDQQDFCTCKQGIV